MEFGSKLSQSLETVGETDYLIVFLSLLLCIISSFMLMYVYKNKSNSLSSKTQIATIIPFLSNITFLVILVVKSSLALSLGLVGALSVIRFRTPVKEPEDLAFLFFCDCFRNWLWSFTNLFNKYNFFNIINNSLVFFI